MKRTSFSMSMAYKSLSEMENDSKIWKRKLKLLSAYRTPPPLQCARDGVSLMHCCGTVNKDNLLSRQRWRRIVFLCFSSSMCMNNSVTVCSIYSVHVNNNVSTMCSRSIYSIWLIVLTSSSMYILKVVLLWVLAVCIWIVLICILAVCAWYCYDVF